MMTFEKILLCLKQTEKAKETPFPYGSEYLHAILSLYARAPSLAAHRTTRNTDGTIWYEWNKIANENAGILREAGNGDEVTFETIQKRYSLCVGTAVTHTKNADRYHAAIEARWWGAILREYEARKAFPNEPEAKTKSTPDLTEAISRLYQLHYRNNFDNNSQISAAHLYWMLRPEHAYMLPTVPHIRFVTEADNDLDVAVTTTGLKAAKELASNVLASNSGVPKSWKSFDVTAVRELLEILLLPTHQRPGVISQPYSKQPECWRILVDFIVSPLAILLNPKTGIPFYQHCESMNRWTTRVVNALWWFVPLLILLCMASIVRLGLTNWSPTFLALSATVPLVLYLLYVSLIAAFDRLPVFGIGGRLAWKLAAPLEKYARDKKYVPINIALIGSSRAGKSTWLANLLQQWKEPQRHRGFLKDEYLAEVSKNPSTRRPTVTQIKGDCNLTTGSIPSVRNEVISVLDTRGQELNRNPNVRFLQKHLPWVHAIVLVRPAIFPTTNGVPPADHINQLIGSLNGIFPYDRHGNRAVAKMLVLLLTRADASGCNTPQAVANELSAVPANLDTWRDCSQMNLNAGVAQYPATEAHVFGNWGNANSVQTLYTNWSSAKEKHLLGQVGVVQPPPQNNQWWHWLRNALRVRSKPSPVPQISNATAPYAAISSAEQNSDLTFLMVRDLRYRRAKQNYHLDRSLFLVSTLVCSALLSNYVLGFAAAAIAVHLGFCWVAKLRS